MTIYHGSHVVVSNPDVAYGRKGGRQQRRYDIVEGGVANDNVIDTVEDYENGVITAEQALGQLKYKKVNHQICIHKQEVVDQFLHFHSCQEVKRA